MATVKRVNRRSERAAETRRRIVEAARDLFVEQGYGATVLPDVARRAGVSVQNIYFVFGNKRSLLKEVVDVTVAGDFEPVATMDRQWYRDALAADDAPSMLRAYVAGTGEVVRRVAPITKMLTAAASTDPEITQLWPPGVDPRAVVVGRAAEALVGKPGVRPDVTVAQATDVMYALLGPELYLVLVEARGWSHAQWCEWVHETLAAQLLQPRRGRARRT